MNYLKIRIKKIKLNKQNERTKKRQLPIWVFNWDIIPGPVFWDYLDHQLYPFGNKCG